MKKGMVILFLGLMLCSAACRRGGETPPGEASTPLAEEAPRAVPDLAQEVSAKFESALEHFQEGRVLPGAVHLLDVVLMTRPAGGWPDGVEPALREARAGFETGETASALPAVNRALDLLDPAREAPGPAGEIGPVAELVRNKIEAAREAFIEGEADRGARLVLEALRLLGPAGEAAV